MEFFFALDLAAGSTTVVFEVAQVESYVPTSEFTALVERTPPARTHWHTRFAQLAALFSR